MNQPAAVLLTTFSGYDRCVSILATTNSQAYLETVVDFVGTVESENTGNIFNCSENSGQNQQQPTEPQAGFIQNGFQYTTSNFDDGWTA